MQYSIFDYLEQVPLNKEIESMVKCDDYRLLNAISKSIVNFQQLPKHQEYCLSFSGGKDSHVLLAVYCLYLKLGNEPLNLTVKFADTELEHESLYKTVYLARDFCQKNKIPFEIVKGRQSYWYVQYALGYPVPDYFARWCTGKLKVQPMQPSKRIKAITGRHLGESTSRDKKLKENNSCGSSDTCGVDLIKNKYDPIMHWTNCLVWDALFYFDGLVLYDGVFDLLQSQYKMAADTKTGSLRLGCFMCPVIALNTAKKNLNNGIIDDRGLEIRMHLEELRKARRIQNPRTQKNGAIHVSDRRKSWQSLNKKYLLEKGWIKQVDIEAIDKALESQYAYPPTYKKEWIDLQHHLLEETDKKNASRESPSR